MRPGTLLRYYALKQIINRTTKDAVHVFDLGGYDGFLASKLKQEFPLINITVVDMDKTGLEKARKAGLNTLNASVLELPVQDGTIDAILCLDVIEHIKEDTLLIQEISRVLKEDGIIILTTPCEGGVTFPFLSKARSELVNRQWGHVRKGYSLHLLIKLLEEEHLAVVKIDRYFNFISRLFYSFSFIDRLPLMPAFFRLIAPLERYIKLGAQEHIIIAKKIKYKNEL